MRRLLLQILFLLIITPTFAQNVSDRNKPQLASKYYNNKEYEKAADLYQELYKTSNSSHYFDYYINSLIGMKDFDTAVKELKKQIRKTKNSDNFEITLGFVYKQMGDIAQSNKTYNKIIDDLPVNKGKIIRIGNKFFQKREFEYAEKTYLKGRELIEGEMFHSNLASIYGYMRNYDNMIVEYLALVKENEKNISLVKSRISALIRYDFDNSLRETVKKQIIKSIQSDPTIIAYNRLLIWMFTIEKNYEQALLNSIALDKRIQTEENNILNFATKAAGNNLFDVALKGLIYLQKRTSTVTNINKVEQEIAKTEYLRYINTPQNKRATPENITQKFETVFNKIGYTPETSKLVATYAHFLAFYLNKSDEAITQLNKGLKIQRLNSSQLATLKLEMADINVYSDNLWEAALEYAQIIETNRENNFGYEALLKKAKVSFYLGDIQWAQGQLDILKAGTSHLIANDAMELSLLITSNYDLDTIEKPIQLFAKGDLFLFQNKDSLAAQTYDSILTLYPTHSLSDKILMRKATISEKEFDYEKTASIYEKIISDYSYSTSADDAMYKLALLYETKLNNTNKAQELYNKILTSYPASIYVSFARKRFRILRGDFVEEEVTPYEEHTLEP